MKRFLFFISFIYFAAIAAGQDGSEHKIITIIGAGRVEINTGEQFKVEKNDVFQVFGKGQVIHPATGKLVQRDNVYIGKIIVIEVKELSSVCEIVEKKGEFSAGNKIVKVVSEEQAVVENKRPIQAEFENPKERNYAETIYTQKEKKGSVNKDVHIVKITEENSQPIAVIDKGENTKAKGGNPSIGKKYHVFVPEVDTSAITGQKHISGEIYIGQLNITGVEHDASTGKLSLQRTMDYGFIEKDNILRTFIPITKGFLHIIIINPVSVNFNLGSDPISFLNSIYTMHGYLANSVFFIGGGIGYTMEYYDNYTETLVKNLPIFIHTRFNILNKKTSPTINLSIGKNNVLNKHDEKRVYDLKGGFYFNGGIGLRNYVINQSSILIEANFTLCMYDFKYPKYFNPESLYESGTNTIDLSLSIGYSF